MKTSLLLLALAAAPASAATFQDTYLERWFDMYPSKATAAGRHDLDRRLEDLSPARRHAWVTYNRGAAKGLRRILEAPRTSAEDRLDAELLVRQAELEVFEYDTQDRPGRDPLFWTGILSEATVFLLVRDDLPQAERLSRAAERASQIPRLAGQARQALRLGDPARISPEICGLAAQLARGFATFYREGFPQAGDNPDLKTSGEKAAAAFDELAAYLDELQKKAKGYPRLGKDYAARFRLVTGVDEPVERVLAQAEAALIAKRAEAAAYGRSVWKELMPPGESTEEPADDRELLRRLFERIAADRAADMAEFVADYRKLVPEALDFVRRKDLMTLPDPPTLYIERSPPYFVGQVVGGVYASGPYAPEEDTLFYLPAIPDSATPEEKTAFFRDFNHPFNVMIVPHEMVPGHYVQLKWAARHPRKVRALFSDGVYVEGWGTFSERLLLDQGWGGPLARLAHLKKQLENIARTVVDIRVNTQEMSQGAVLRYVKEEALQDEQFAGMMWVRAITSSPQLTFYWLGDREVQGLYDEVRKAKGEAFRIKTFLDGMMELGPVPVRHYRERMMEESTNAGAPPAPRPDPPPPSR